MILIWQFYFIVVRSCVLQVIICPGRSSFICVSVILQLDEINLRITVVVVARDCLIVPEVLTCMDFEYVDLLSILMGVLEYGGHANFELPFMCEHLVEGEFSF